MPEIGEDLAGYKIDSVAGRGGMGVVFRAEHLHLSRIVALKVLTADLAGNRSFRQRFIREARTAARLDHPNIVPVFDAGEVEGLLYIAMKYIDGVDLGHVLDNEERLSAQRTVDLLADIADALDVAHGAGLVHRDVKPGNVLVDNARSYLTDFGLTKRIASRTALTAAGRTVGTAAYLAPEQIRGQDVDARTDIYAFGCVLYECLTGDVPFVRDTDMAVLWATPGTGPRAAECTHARAAEGARRGLRAGTRKAQRGPLHELRRADQGRGRGDGFRTAGVFHAQQGPGDDRAGGE
jgi:serine/threonine protein kinase